MKGRALAAALIASAALALGGCGGDDDDGGGEKTFDEDGFALTFSYPADFESATDLNVDQSVGSEDPGMRAGVALDDENGVFVIKTGLNFPVTAENLAKVQPEVDSLFTDAAGHPLRGERTELGGLPALAYEPFAYAPTDVTTRLTVIFDRADEYELNCQWDDRHEVDVQDACDLALRTLEQKPS